MLIQRIVTAAVFGVAVIAAIVLLPSVWVGCLLGALWLVGAREWARFARLSTGATIAWVVAHGVVMVLAGQFVAATMFVYVALAAALLWWLMSIALLVQFPRELSPTIAIVAGAGTLLPAWGLLAWLHSTVPDGAQLILFMLAIVWSADTGAYFAGRSLGRNKLAPTVSPGKTWEGVVGGLLLAGLTAAVAAHFAGFDQLRFSLVAIATAAISVVGDLNVSMFKRNAGLKDSGRLLPGHGGALDRMDSVTAAAPMFVLGLIVAGIIT